MTVLSWSAMCPPRSLLFFFDFFLLFTCPAPSHRGGTHIFFLSLLGLTSLFSHGQALGTGFFTCACCLLFLFPVGGWPMPASVN